MTTFSYVALEPSGQRKTGFIDAATKEAAIAAVSTAGRFVLEIKEEGSKKPTARMSNDVSKRKGKVSRSELALFSRRMADLSEAGLPLDRVLQVVAEQSESFTLTEIAESALKEVRSGKPISDALASHPKLFPTVYTQTLRAGETSGQFPEVTGRLAEFQENEVARRSQVVSALIYPTILGLTAIFVVIFLLTFVVPRLSNVFAGMGDDLPGSTKLLLASTDLLTKRWYVVVGSIIFAIIAYRMWTSTNNGKVQRDALILRMPVLGPVIKKATVSRFARVLSTLLFGGVPILQALELSGLAAGNRVFLLSAQQVEHEVREGVAIAQAMRDAGAFPPVLTHMVAIGEETGDLPKMLGRVADSLDFEVDNGMRRLTAMVEPIIVLFMGSFVGFVVLSVLLPIYAAQNSIK